MKYNKLNNSKIELLLQAVLELSAEIMLDQKNPFGKHIHVCAKTDCTKIFITKHGRGGGRNSKGENKRYCCKQHQVEQDSINARFRMQKLREKHGL